MTSICTFTLTWNHGSTILIFDWIINWFFVSTGCHSWTKTSFSCVSAADNSKIIMEFVFCGFVLSMLWYAYRSCSFVMFLILAFWTMYDQLYCISWTIINYTGLIRNTICCWYLMMEASVHIIAYVLHLDLSSSNKSYSSSVILLLHKHIQRITIAQCHSLVADTTLRWNVHLRIFRSLINLVSRHFEWMPTNFRRKGKLSSVSGMLTLSGSRSSICNFVDTWLQDHQRDRVFHFCLSTNRNMFSPLFIHMRSVCMRGVCSTSLCLIVVNTKEMYVCIDRHIHNRQTSASRSICFIRLQYTLWHHTGDIPVMLFKSCNLPRLCTISEYASASFLQKNSILAILSLPRFGN